MTLITMRIWRVRGPIGELPPLYSGKTLPVRGGVARDDEVLEACLDRPWSEIEQWARGIIAEMPRRERRLFGGKIIFCEVRFDLRRMIPVPDYVKHP